MTDNAEPRTGEILPPEQTRTSIVEYQSTAAALGELWAKYHGATFDVTTPKGMKEARAARAVLSKLRTTLEKQRLDLKRDYVKRLDGEAARIQAVLSMLEDPIAQVIDAEEQRAAKLAAEAAEREERRLKVLGQRIDFLKGIPGEVAKATTVARLEQLEALLGQVDVTPGTFAERLDEAMTLHAEALAIVRSNAARVRQAEADAAELAKLRQEAADRAAREAAEQARAVAAPEAIVAERVSPLPPKVVTETTPGAPTWPRRILPPPQADATTRPAPRTVEDRDDDDDVDASDPIAVLRRARELAHAAHEHPARLDRGDACLRIVVLVDRALDLHSDGQFGQGCAGG